MNFEGLPLYALGGGGGGGGGGGEGTVTSVGTDSTLQGGPITTIGILGIAPSVMNHISTVVGKTQHINADPTTTTFTKSSGFILGQGEVVEMVTDSGFPILLANSAGVRIESKLITDEILPFSDGTRKIGTPNSRYRNIHLSDNVFCGNLVSSAGSDFNSVANQTSNNTANVSTLVNAVGTLQQKTSTLSVSTFTAINDNLQVSGKVIMTPVVASVNSAALVLQTGPNSLGGYLAVNSINDLSDPNASIDTKGAIKAQKSIYSAEDVFCRNVITDQANLNAISALTANLATNVSALEQKTSTLSVNSNDTSIGDQLVVTGGEVIISRNFGDSNSPSLLIVGSGAGYLLTQNENDTDSISHASIETPGGLRVAKNLAVATINGLTPNGGLYLQLQLADIVGQTAGSFSLFTYTFNPLAPTPSIGSLRIPALSNLAHFRIHLSGRLNSDSNAPVIFRLDSLKSGRVTLHTLDSQMIKIEDRYFSLEYDITIVSTNLLRIHGMFSFDAPSNNFRGTLATNTFNADTFNEIPLDVTVEFSTPNVNNNVQLIQAVMTRTY